jgi:hypothetical protein
MSNQNTPKEPKEPKESKNVKVKLVKDCYGAYRIADPVGKTRTVSAELAEKMIASKHAEKA